jgi:hypothetical protein
MSNGCYRGFQTTTRANPFAQKILEFNIMQGLNSTLTWYSPDNCKPSLGTTYMKDDLGRRAVFEWYKDAPRFQLQFPVPPLLCQWPQGPHVAAVSGESSFVK